MRTEYDSPKPVQNISISLGKRQLADSIWKAAGIEGLGTTFPDTERILDNLPVNTRRDEVLFIVNMKRAWQFIFDNIDYPNNLMFLRQLNSICLDNLTYGAGELRRVSVAIGGTDWKPDMPDEAAIIQKIQSIDSKADKLESALDMFCFIARSQIFIDGNKRVAQLMCNKIMMQNDLGIFSIPYNQIDKFKEKLVRFYETDDSRDLKRFFHNTSLQLNPDNMIVKKHQAPYTR